MGPLGILKQYYDYDNDVVQSRRILYCYAMHVCFMLWSSYKEANIFEA